MKFLTKLPWNLCYEICTKNKLWNQTFPSLFIAIIFSFVYEERMDTLRYLKQYYSSCRFIFSHLQVHYFSFNNFFLVDSMNKSRLILSLAVPCFVFNFKWRKSEQTLIVFDTKSLIQNQLKKNMLKTSFI